MNQYSWDYVPSWPEWNDVDLNNEKWESYGFVTKNQTTHFEDPDGNEWFPSTLGPLAWKRPAELIHPKVLCVMDNQNLDFDLLTSNKHLIHIELMRLIINQVISLVNLTSRKSYLLPEPVTNVFIPCDHNVWKPWHHVYSLCKAGKISHQPTYNSWGKYVVRLFWMGSWRKIYVDDFIPVSFDGKWLLPTTQKPQELWPVILTKALLKVASLEYSIIDARDFSAIKCLSGWLPERITLVPHYHTKTWEILSSCCPKYEWPNQSDSEKDMNLRKQLLKSQDIEPTVNHNPACVIAFAEFLSNPCYDEGAKLGQKLNAILQSLNLTNKLKHSIYVTEIRTKSLQPPQSSQEIPSWKLIRRQLWDQNYMSKTMDGRIKCLGLFLPWTLADLADDVKKEYVPREREMSTVKNPMMNVRMRRERGRDVQKYCETIQVQWIKFEDFWKCFRSLCVFHKVSSYQYCYKLVDMKLVQNKKITKVQTACRVHFLEEGRPIYLFTENLEVTEILVSLAVNGNLPNTRTTTPVRYDSSTSLYFCDTGGESMKLPSRGYLIVESFDWQKQKPVEVILTLKTAASRGNTLVLPPGRHVLSLTTRSSFGCITTICSNTAIVVGDEEVIFPKLTSESQRFAQASESILHLLLACFSSFGYPSKFNEAEGQLYSAICPNPADKRFQSCYSIFGEAVVILIARILDVAKLPAEVAFALRVFTLLPYSTIFNEAKISTYLGKKFIDDSSIKDHFTSDEELLKGYQSRAGNRGLITLQSYVRRFLVRNIVIARLQSNKYQKRVSEQLTRFVTIIRRQENENAVYLLRTYFHLAPGSVKQFSFYSDECNSILSLDYNGVTAVANGSKDWMVVFRDVIHVLDDQALLTPYFNCNLSTWSLHVVDNDSLEQIPENVLKTYQRQYNRNKYGYTILVRVLSDANQKDVKWTLKVVSPLGSLISPTVKDTSVGLAVKEIINYYCPNKKNIIARYSIQSQKECIMTFQFAVSSPKVKLEINVYEEDSCKLTIRGKTQVLIPAVYFHKRNRVDSHTYVYYIEAKVLNDSWLVDPIHIPFIQTLQLKEQMEMHLGSKSEEDLPGDSASSDGTEKDSVDMRKPYWILKTTTANELVDAITIERDKRRLEEIIAVKRTWEKNQPGRFIKAQNARQNFLQKYAVDSISSSFHRDSLGRSSDISQKLDSWDILLDDLSDMSPLQFMKVLPEPINTKIRLKPWNIASHIRRLRPVDGPAVKDKALSSLQVLVQKKIFENYNAWRNGVKARQEQLKLKQYCERALLYDTHRQWQKRMNTQRKDLLEERAVYRQQLIQQEEINQAALMKVVEEIQQKLAENAKKDARKK